MASSVFIDIHNHIIPGVDDGIKVMEESLEALKQARAEGITTMVMTPHIWEGTFDNTPEMLREAFKGLLEKAGDQGPELKLACEAHFHPELGTWLEEEKVLPMGRGSYLLVELPLRHFPMGVAETFYELRLAGIEPILAHPERQPYWQRDPTGLYELLQQGTLTQVTAASLTGYFGKPVRDLAEDLLYRGGIHFVGSDTHSITGRKPVGRAFRQSVAELMGEETAEKICHLNPKAMLAGENVSPDMPRKAPPKKSFFGRLFGK